MVSLAAVSNASMDLGKADTFASATVGEDDGGDGATLLFEISSALKLQSSVSQDVILPSISEEGFSRRLGVSSVA